MSALREGRMMGPLEFGISASIYLARAPIVQHKSKQKFSHHTNTDIWCRGLIPPPKPPGNTICSVRTTDQNVWRQWNARNFAQYLQNPKMWISAEKIFDGKQSKQNYYFYYHFKRQEEKTWDLFPAGLVMKTQFEIIWTLSNWKFQDSIHYVWLGSVMTRNFRWKPVNMYLFEIIRQLQFFDCIWYKWILNRS